MTDSTLTKIKNHPEETATKIKQTDFFKTILPAMRNYYETEHYIFVHGWIPSITNGFGGNVNYFKYDANWRNADGVGWYFSRWYNGMLAASCRVTEPGKTIVCGHWNASYGHSILEGKGSEFDQDSDFTPYYAYGIIAIDACTAVSGFVNCIVLDDEEIIRTVEDR